MSDKRWLKVGLPVIAVFCLILLVRVTSKPADSFDEERFQEDVEKIETMYLERQEQLRDIAQAFWSNAEFHALRVSPDSAEAIELWLESGQLESFEDEYPQLYNDMYALSSVDLFTWLRFSRYDGQGDIIECPVFHDRYGPYWTAFYLYFYPQEEPEINGTYSKHLPGNCLLIARDYPFE